MNSLPELEEQLKAKDEECEKKIESLYQQLSEQTRQQEQTQQLSEQTRQQKQTQQVFEQTRQQEQTPSANQQENESRRSKYKHILHLENFYIDDALYEPFYIEYCKAQGSNSIPLFSEPFSVKKYKKRNENIEFIDTRKINIFYNLKNNKFEVKYYHSNNKVKKIIKNIENIENIIKKPDLENGFTFKDKIYSSDSKNVYDVSSKIKTLIQYFNDNRINFLKGINQFDLFIKNLLDKNINKDQILNKKILKSIHFLDEVQFDIRYIKTTVNYRSKSISESTLKNETLYDFFSYYHDGNKLIYDNYNYLKNFKIPIQYYIKMRIAQTLFSDLPSNFDYYDGKHKRKIIKYDIDKVNNVITREKNRLIQDELFFIVKRKLMIYGKEEVYDSSINAILISCYSDNDQLYIVDHELNVYDLQDSEKLVAEQVAEQQVAEQSVVEAQAEKLAEQSEVAPAAAGVAPPVAEVAPPVAVVAEEGGKRSRQRRRKNSKKINTRKRLKKKKTIRYKKHRKKRSITRN